MAGQTISLFRYLLLGAISRRLVALIMIVLVLATLAAGFIAELAIINSDRIGAALLGDLLRYSLVLLLLLLVTGNVAEDFQANQFDRLLALPLSRWQYIIAQLMVIITIASTFSLSVLAIVAWFTALELAAYWAVALWLELILTGLIGLLGIVSLEKAPQAVFFSIAIYLLARFSGVISQMLSESVVLTDGSLSNRLAEWIFHGVLYVMPSSRAFAQNNMFFEPGLPSELLSGQLLTVTVYSIFLVAACLVDFYRKEFNH